MQSTEWPGVDPFGLGSDDEACATECASVVTVVVAADGRMYCWL